MRPESYPGSKVRGEGAKEQQHRHEVSATLDERLCLSAGGGIRALAMAQAPSRAST